MTMPTAAAPAASAYLAPVLSASTSTAPPMRPCTRISFISSGVTTSTAPNRPALTAVLSMPPTTSMPSAACSSPIKAQFFKVLPLTRVVRPTMAQELMPTNAAR